MKKLAIFGTGGMAKELLDLAIDQSYQEICFIGSNTDTIESLLGFPVFKEDSFFKNPTLFLSYDFAIAVANPKIRKHIWESYPHLHYPNLVHSQASLGFLMKDSLQKSRGIIIAAGARITNSTQLGSFVFISFNSTVGHDCILEDFVSIMPSTNISGCIHLKEGVYIGTNASILPGKNYSTLKVLGQYSIIGAGAVVLYDTKEYSTYVGIPARELNNETSHR